MIQTASLDFHNLFYTWIRITNLVWSELILGSHFDQFTIETGSSQRDGLLSSDVFKVQTKSPDAFVFRVHTCIWMKNYLIILQLSKCLVSSCKALVNLSRALLKDIKMKSICAGQRSCVPVLVCLSCWVKGLHVNGMEGSVASVYRIKLKTSILHNHRKQSKPWYWAAKLDDFSLVYFFIIF